MRRPGWGPSKLLIALVSVALAGCVALAIARSNPVAQPRGGTEVVSGSAGVQAIIARGAEIESCAPRRGGSTIVLIGVAAAVFVWRRHRPRSIQPAWGHASGGPGRAHDRAPPLAV